MSAVFSDCGLYRYRWECEIAPEGRTAFACLVNPSKAGQIVDGTEIKDQTVNKLIGFGQRNGIRRWLLGNLFAGIATDIADLPKLKDPVGPDNDLHLREMMQQADLCIVGWGALNKLPESLRKRWVAIVKLADELGVTLHCIGTNADKHPKHPLMTAYSVPITAWDVPFFIGRKRHVAPPSPHGSDAG